MKLKSISDEGIRRVVRAANIYPDMEADALYADLIRYFQKNVVEISDLDPDSNMQVLQEFKAMLPDLLLDLEDILDGQTRRLQELL